MTQNKKTWTISIVAQTQEENRTEYDALREDIDENKCDELRFVIFQFNQKDQEAEILEKDGKDKKLCPKYLKKEKVSLFDTERLTKFFNDDVLLDDKPSDYHMLITWGHGAGLGYFYFDPQTGSKTKNNIIGGRRNINVDIRDEDELKANNHDFLKNKRKLNMKTAHENLLIANVKKPGDEEKFRAVNESFMHEPHREEFKLRTKLLSADDLAYIMKNSFGEKNEKINVFIANNCWVNMFEVGWTIKDWVDVYAAPQTVVPFGGINYKKLFNALPNIDYSPDAEVRASIQIARNITENFLLQYEDLKKQSKNGENLDEKLQQEKKTDDKNGEDLNENVDVRQISISVNHLKNYGIPELEKEKRRKEFEDSNGELYETSDKTMLGIINKLSNFLIRKLQSPKDKKYFLERIDIARSYCGDFTQQGVSFVDFTSFFCELIKGFQTGEAEELKELYKQFFLLKEQCLLSILSPAELFRFMPTDFYTQSPQMFSIFFPSRFGKSDATENFMNFYTAPDNRSKFQIASRWDDFIMEYWNCS